MDWWQAVLLGIVEGLTEFLPVSSTGHLLLVQRMMGITKGSATDAYAICIQAGAIAAVLGLYLHRIKSMGRGMLGRDADGRKLTINLLVAFIPAAIVGLTLGEFIERELFKLWPIVVAWIIGGIAILLLAQPKRARERGFAVEQLTWRGALMIGLVQCIAMWPGTSRSLVTILAGVLVGMELVAAVEFSFLLGLITLGAATAYKAVNEGGDMVETLGMSNLLLGFVFSTLSAVVAVKWMVEYLQRHSLKVFGWYRIVLGVGVAVVVLLGYLSPD